jgi:succinate dehydrogenase (ubiquinone) cytochrome b560 subunit
MIYAWPVAALSSIAYRATGVMLCAGMYGIGAAALVTDVGGVLASMKESSPLLMGAPAKLAVGFPLMYHYLGGLRHIYWEKNPAGLATESIHQSSVVLAGAAAVGTIGLVATSLPAKEK